MSDVEVGLEEERGRARPLPRRRLRAGKGVAAAVLRPRKVAKDRNSRLHDAIIQLGLITKGVSSCSVTLIFDLFQPCVYDV